MNHGNGQQRPPHRGGGRFGSNNQVQITNERVWCEIPRGDRGDVLRVTSARANGHLFFQIREFYQTEEGEIRPGKKGISIKTREIVAVVDSLRKAMEASK